LFQKDVKALKNIMHLKTNKYARNEIMSKRTLSQKSKRSMSLSSRQRSVSVVQITSNQSNNAFNVLKDRFNSRIKSESTLTFTTTSLDSQIQSTLKSRDRLSNSRKTIESSQNEKL
jgi:secreted PhoX family phosphatase